MGKFVIKKGRNLRMEGVAEKKIIPAELPKQIVIKAEDFIEGNFRALVSLGSQVKVGSPILEGVTLSDVKIVSPVSGTIFEIDFGKDKNFNRIIIQTDGKQECLSFEKITSPELITIERKDVLDQLLRTGLWPFIRQQPKGNIAHPEEDPKSIFIHAMNTEPLALDPDFILEGQQREFQAGLDIIKHLTDGHIHLCFSSQAKSSALTHALRVKSHQFTGPHPAGNIQTHIHWVDRMKEEEIVWSIEAQDVLRIGYLFLEGMFSPLRIIAVTGEGVDKRHYIETVLGSPIADMVGEFKENMRYISGSILSGKEVGYTSPVGYYDTQITVVPRLNKKTLWNWFSVRPDLSRK